MDKKNNPKNKGGRPTKLTLKLQDKICDAIRKGNYAITACRLAGIGERTYYLWKEKGEQEKKCIYSEFLEAIEQADAEAEASLLETIQGASPEDWRAAETVLARRWPGRWGRKDKQELEVTEIRKIKYVPAGEKDDDK